MDLTKDIIPKKQFYLAIQLLMLASIIMMGWFTYLEYKNFDEFMLNDRKESSFEANDLIFRSDSVQQGTQSKLVRYVTVKELSYPATEQQEDQILNQNFGYATMTGLESYPSFMIRNEHTSFWQSQYTLSIALKYGGHVGFMIFVIVFVAVNFKQDQKIFTKEKKYLIYGLSMGLFAYFFLEMVLYGRMILFLNEEFYLGEHIVGGVSEPLLWLAMALTIFVTYIEKGIPMQEEQDLTV